MRKGVSADKWLSAGEEWDTGLGGGGMTKSGVIDSSKRIILSSNTHADLGTPDPAVIQPRRVVIVDT